MKLKSLKIMPNGKDGLESNLLLFGESVTQLFGPNGCGKTPTVQSIVFCLGYPSIFREEIYRRCSHAILEFSVENDTYVVSRVFSKDVDITVRGPLGQTSKYYSEAEYSAFIFEILGIPYVNLVTTSNKLGTPYIATILPIFYLDQDDGYRDFYSPPSKFIKDQFSEMMRLVFDLPVKNSFDARKDKIAAKEELVRLDELVHKRQREVESAKHAIGLAVEETNLQKINEQIIALESELKNLRFSGDQNNEAAELINRLIRNNAELIRDTERKISEINKRSKSLATIIEEINVEINTLNLNEESRRIFLSFSEICESASCQLFSVSSAAYGKNLLYLKDQIKDLERNSSADQAKLEVYQLRKYELEKQNSNLISDREIILKGSEIGALVDSISKIKGEIFTLQSIKSEIEKIKSLESRYFETIISRDRALDIYETFSKDSSSSPTIIKLRTEIRSLYLKWLDIINTDNFSKDISFHDDFSPIFGIETIGQLKGSTKVRAVLAFHAALIELVMKKTNGLFRFLILDTPKQHDINNEDLGAYISALKNLSTELGVQIVFSNTEFHYIGDEYDVEWTPSHPGDKHKMFYKKPVYS